MPKGTYQVGLKRRREGGEVEFLDAGTFTVDALDYDSIDDTLGLMHLRANKTRYGYAVEDGLVYFGPHAVQLSEFAGLEVRLLSKENESLATS